MALALCRSLLGLYVLTGVVRPGAEGTPSGTNWTCDIPDTFHGTYFTEETFFQSVKVNGSHISTGYPSQPQATGSHFPLFNCLQMHSVTERDSDFSDDDVIAMTAIMTEMKTERYVCVRLWKLTSNSNVVRLQRRVSEERSISDIDPDVLCRWPPYAGSKSLLFRVEPDVSQCPVVFQTGALLRYSMVDAGRLVNCPGNYNQFIPGVNNTAFTIHLAACNGTTTTIPRDVSTTLQCLGEWLDSDHDIMIAVGDPASLNFQCLWSVSSDIKDGESSYMVSISMGECLKHRADRKALVSFTVSSLPALLDTEDDSPHTKGDRTESLVNSGQERLAIQSLPLIIITMLTMIT